MEVTVQPWSVVLFCLILILYYALFEKYNKSSNSDKQRDQGIALFIFFIIILISIGVDPLIGGYIACNMMLFLASMIIWDIPIPTNPLSTEEKYIELTRYSVLFSSIIFSVSFTFMTLPLNIAGGTVGFIAGAIVFFVLGILMACDESSSGGNYRENPVLILFFAALFPFSNSMISVFAFGKNSNTNFDTYFGTIFLLYGLFVMISGLILLSKGKDYDHEAYSTFIYASGMLVLFLVTLFIDNSVLFIVYILVSIGLMGTTIGLMLYLLFGEVKKKRPVKSDKITEISPKYREDQIEDDQKILTEIINSFIPIRNEIKLTLWSLINENIESLKSKFKSEKNKLGLKTVKAFNKYLEGLELIRSSNPNKATKKLINALKSFPEMGFEIEQFKIYANLGILYKKQENKKKAEKSISHSWKYYKKCSEEEFQKWGDSHLKKYVLNEIYLSRNKIKEVDQLITILEEKLSIVNKETDKTEYETIQEEFIVTLINNKEFNKLFEYFSAHNIQIDDYLTQFETIFLEFTKKPSIDLALTLSKIYTLEYIQNKTKKIIDEWKEKSFSKMYKIFYTMREEMIEEEEFRAIVDLFLGSEKGALKFIIDISYLIKTLLEDPKNDTALSFLSNIKNAFENSDNDIAADIIDSWLQTIYTTRSVSPDQKSNFDNFLQIFKISFDIDSPISLLESQTFLIKKFFKIRFNSDDFKTDFEVCQAFSDFINKTNDLSEKILDSEKRRLILKKFRLINLEYFLRAWVYNSVPNIFKLKDSIDPLYKQYLIDKLYPFHTEIKNQVLIIALLEEKLSFIRKEINELEYQEIKQKISNIKHSYIMSLLTKDKNHIDAIRFLEIFNLKLDPYIDHFQSFYKAIRKNPSVNTMDSFLKIFSLDCIDPENKAIIDEWKNNLSSKIYKFYINNRDKIVQKGAFKQIVNFIIKYSEDSQKFFEDLFNFARQLFKEPHDKKIMSFLLYTNEILQETGNKLHAETIHSWITVTIQLRKISRDSKAFFDIILQAFKSSEDHFIPLTLLGIYYDENFSRRGYTSDIGPNNRFSEFLGEISNLVYSSSDFPNKDFMVNQIYEYTKALAESYSNIILSRMRNQTIDYIQSLGRNALPYVASSLMQNISSHNPAPISRALIILINKWRILPVLEKTNYFGYQIQTVSLKPNFWLGVFQLILAHHYGEYYQRLTKNEIVHHKNLLEIVEAYLTFFYEVQQLPEVNISYSENRDHTIEFLKKISEQNQFTNEEIRSLINSTNWSGDAKYILKKVIEEKNFCIYCSYNMPPKSKKCPNCGKEVKKISVDETSIDFGAMSDFFGSGS
ncbi:MAG: hypothetical protein HWN67_11275 [Candidatus Helarchaeota archaeon]|nr:hypothetical protein [Candidatus Helarchaeota archaeon]